MCDTKTAEIVITEQNRDSIETFTSTWLYSERIIELKQALWEAQQKTPDNILKSDGEYNKLENRYLELQYKHSKLSKNFIDIDNKYNRLKKQLSVDIPEGKTTFAERNSIMEKVVIAVSLEFGISVEEIRGKSQKMYIGFPRHIFCYISHDFKVPLENIGHFLSRSHATVINSIRKADNAIDTDKALSLQVSQIKESVAIRS